MGLLTNLINAELDKKRDERQFQMKAYYDALASGQVKPGQESMAWDLFKKQVPKDAHGLVDNFIKPLTMLRAKKKQGEQIGSLGRQPGDESGKPVGGGGAQGSGAGAGVAESPLYTPDEMAKQKAMREVQTATMKQRALDAVKRDSDALTQAGLQQRVITIGKRTDIDDATKHDLISQELGRTESEFDYKPGVMVDSSGKVALPVTYRPSDQSKFKVRVGQGPEAQMQELVVPPHLKIIPVEDYLKKGEGKPPTEAEKKDIEIFGNYKEKHDIKDRELTNSEKIQARADAAAEEKAKTQNKDDRAIAIYAKPIAARTPEEKDYLKGYEEFTKKTKVDPGVMRAQIYLQGRELGAVDTQTGNLTFASPKEIQSSPGRFAPASQATAAMGKQAVFQDLHYNIDTARKAITALDSMDTKTRAALSYALRHTDPASALQTFMTGEAMTALTPQQQEAVQALALLSENAMSLRSVSGMGAGSDELRAAIQATLPSGKSPSKGYALEQLNKFESVVNRLQTGVPRLGNQLPGASGGSTGGNVRYKSGDKTYNIPAGQVQDFLKDHPQAVKQ